MQVPAPASLPSQRLIRQQLAHQRPDRLVENRHVFGSEHAELNIYETFEEAQQVALQFHHPVVIGMIEGKKVMHFVEQAPFGFYPNETLILPAGEAMHIDFPEATAAQPTRCLALLISEELVRETLAQHAEALSRYRGENVEVCQELGNYSVLRNPHIAQNIDRIVQLFLEKDQQARPLFIDYSIKELIIRVLQTEARHTLLHHCGQYAESRRLARVAAYIQAHLHEEISGETLCQLAGMSQASFYRYFKMVFGISPTAYILQEKVKKAAEILVQPDKNVSDAAYASGFNSLHYFGRVFKKITGLTPSAYKAQRQLNVRQSKK